MDFFRTGNSKCQQYLLSFSLGLLLGIFLMVNINFNSISNNLKPVITTSVRTANNSRDQVKRRFPRALIIGSMKSGTEALRIFLTLHPDIISTTVEETGFFSKTLNFNKGTSWYLNLMPLSKPEQITIEKSIYFSENKDCPARVSKFNNTIKLILILRNPVIRFISHYARAKIFHRHIRKTRSVEDLIFDPKTGLVNEKSDFIHRSNYYIHMLKWMKHFPLKQFLVLDGDAYAQNPLPGLKQAEEFLGLEHKLDNNSIIYNRRKGFYCYQSDEETKCLPRNKGRRHPFISNKTLKRLHRYFKPLNDKLYTLLRMDFIKNWNKEQF